MTMISNEHISEFLDSFNNPKQKIVALKLSCMDKIPECCDECIYSAVRPDPFDGWVDLCELCNINLTRDRDENWHYDGNSRPKNCPLIEVEL